MDKKSFIIVVFFFIIMLGYFYFFMHEKNTVHIIDDIFTKNECENIINYCENHNKWKIYNSNSYITCDILIKTMPDLEQIVNNTIYEKIIPEFEAKYNISKNLLKIDTNKLFVIKYYNETSDNDNSIAGYHKDPAPFSFNIALNHDFDGGGTHFLQENIHVNNPVGSCLLFPGGKTHSGIKINRGVRYIIYGSLQL